MAQKLAEALGELPSGKVIPLSMDQMSKFLRDNYLHSDAEDARRTRMRKRRDLYEDRGEAQITEVVEAVFKNAENQRLRKAFIPYARFQNVTKRIINEISTVYSEPAQRLVRSGNKSYQQLLRDLSQDRKLRKVNRLTNLLNETLVMFRVNKVDMVPTLDIITPDNFYAVSHPLDPAKLIGVIFSSKPQGKQITVNDPHWTLWSAAETFRLDGNGRIISESYRLHEYERIPGELIHREIPDQRLLDADSGEDLVSAHKAVALLNVLMLKEQKSGTKQGYTVGDVGETAMGQQHDSETMVHFDEGITPGTLDLGADPRTFIDATRAVIKQVAANYQIPESVFDLSYQASSGFEIELKRVGLREKRRDQVMDFRDTERSLVDLQARVLASDLPELAFSTDGWAIDFGEVETPQDPMQMLEYWRKLREMSLGNTVDFAMQLNPEFSEKQASAWIEANIQVETLRVMAMKTLAQLNGSANSAPGEPTAQENGQAGQEAVEAAGNATGEESIQ